LIKKESKFLFTVNTGLLKGIENGELRMKNDEMPSSFSIFNSQFSIHPVGDGSSVASSCADPPASRTGCNAHRLFLPNSHSSRNNGAVESAQPCRDVARNVSTARPAFAEGRGIRAKQKK
jgi:hypothetical protein